VALRCIFGSVLLLSLCLPLWGQQTSETAPVAEDPVSVFHHSDRSRWYISGQLNTIFQTHPEFPARYSGPNSLRSTSEAADSQVLTLYTGYQLTGTTEVFFDLESAGGRGISNALGLAGFTNLDVVRNPSLGATPYMARLLMRQIIPLSHDKVEQQRDFLHLATEVPVRRFEFRAGRFSTVDFLDQNAVGSDSHLQFMNWTIDNNGGFDYAADTRGYTWGAMVEYYDRGWTVRFLEALMPKEANGLTLDWNLRRARAENMEVELRPRLIAHKTTVRLLSYVNHANMGDYREAVSLFRQGITSVPDVIATRRQGRVKYGFGANLEQELPSGFRAFARFGWNEGRHESYAYTEVNQSVVFGADRSGERWRRPHDRAGAAFVSNAISHDHQEYLALGGIGFLLGDGALNYRREQIFEAYYTAHLWRGVFGSLDLQHIGNPGYNRDRGPVWVPAMRLHVDF
jgi:hypothetical protein